MYVCTNVWMDGWIDELDHQSRLFYSLHSTTTPLVFDPTQQGQVCMDERMDGWICASLSTSLASDSNPNPHFSLGSLSIHEHTYHNEYIRSSITYLPTYLPTYIYVSIHPSIHPCIHPGVCSR